MKLEIETIYNIGDKVLVKKPHAGAFIQQEPFEAEIDGIIVNKNSKATRIYYTVKSNSVITACADYNKKKKYNKNELELIEAKNNEQI